MATGWYAQDPSQEGKIVAGSTQTPVGPSTPQPAGIQPQAFDPSGLIRFLQANPNAKPLDYFNQPTHFNELQGDQGAQIGGMSDAFQKQNPQAGSNVNRTGYRINFNETLPASDSGFVNAWNSSAKDAASAPGVINVAPGAQTFKKNAEYENFAANEAANAPLMGEHLGQTGYKLEDLLNPGGQRAQEEFGNDILNPGIQQELGGVQSNRQAALKQLQDMNPPPGITRDEFNDEITRTRFDSNFLPHLNADLAMMAANKEQGNGGTWGGFARAALPAIGFYAGGAPGAALFFGKQAFGQAKNDKSGSPLDQAFRDAPSPQDFQFFQEPSRQGGGTGKSYHTMDLRR